MLSLEPLMDRTVAVWGLAAVPPPRVVEKCWTRVGSEGASPFAIFRSTQLFHHPGRFGRVGMVFTMPHSTTISPHPLS